MLEEIITLVTMSTLLLGSPGPAPLALAAIGASFGFKKGIPFLTGILSGLAVAVIGAIVGFTTLFALYPSAKTVLQILGSLYILYVAFKIATAPVTKDSNAQEKIPSFADGFILNLLNPKAYAAFFALFSQFSLPLESSFVSLVITGVIGMLVATVVDILWLMLGGVIRPIFNKPRQARILRIVFAILMIIAVGWTLIKSVN